MDKKYEDKTINLHGEINNNIGLYIFSSLNRTIINEDKGLISKIKKIAFNKKYGKEIALNNLVLLHYNKNG